MLKLLLRVVNLIFHTKKHHLLSIWSCWMICNVLIITWPSIALAKQEPHQSHSESPQTQDDKINSLPADKINAMNDKEGKPDSSQEQIEFTPLEIYHKLFQQKRQSHMEAVKTIVKLGAYDKQYKMVKILLEKMTTVLTESKVLLMELGYSPGDSFPEAMEAQDALSKVAENTAFFGDLLLRLPDITHDILNRNREWELVAKWGVGFCNDTNIMQGTDLKLLNLVGQEIGLIPQDPEYQNPYKMKPEQKEKKIKEELEALLKDKMKAEKKQEKARKREKLKKGPRLSNVGHSEF